MSRTKGTTYMPTWSPRIAVGVCVVVMGLGLAGCGGSAEKVEPKATRSAPSPAQSSTPTPTATATTSAPTPKATPTRPTIDSVTKDKPFVSGVGLPKDFPKAVPLPATGSIVKASGTMEGWTIEFSGVPARDVEALRASIKSAGGAEVYAIPGADLATAAYEMTGYALQLMWMPKAKGKETSFVYTVSKRSA